MKAQVLLSNIKYQPQLIAILKKLNFNFEISSNIENFKEDCLSRKPTIFFVQADSESTLEVILLVKDLRSFFGAIATVIIFGNVMSRPKLVNFLLAGANQFFPFPFDESMIEDFLNKNTGDSYFNAFKYRNIPSQYSEIDIDFELELVEFNAKGIIFQTCNIIKNGTYLQLDLEQISSRIPYKINVEVLQSEVISDGIYLIHSYFHEVSEHIKNMIIEELRNI